MHFLNFHLHTLLVFLMINLPLTENKPQLSDSFKVWTKNTFFLLLNQQQQQNITMQPKSGVHFSL